LKGVLRASVCIFSMKLGSAEVSSALARPEKSIEAKQKT